MNIYDAHCYTAGEGETVLILHPFRRDGFAANPVVEQLSRQFRVYSITLPGFGDVRDDLPDSMEAFIDFLEKFTASKYLESFVLIGISLGANLALNYAVRNPDKLIKLVLVNPAGLRDLSFWMRSPFRSVLRHSLKRRFSAKDSTLQFLQRYLIRKKCSLGPYLTMEAFQKKSGWPGQAAAAVLILGRCPGSLNRSLYKIQKPVLVVGSKSDRLVPDREIRMLEGMLQTVNLQWVDRAGHLGVIENPEAYFIKIEQFI